MSSDLEVAATVVGGALETDDPMLSGGDPDSEDAMTVTDDLPTSVSWGYPQSDN